MPTLPSAILFDWDNTLVSTMSIIQKATEATFHQMGSSVADVSNATHRGGRSMRDFFQDAFGERWQEAGAFYRQYYHEHRFGHLQAMEDSGAVLQFLATETPVWVGAVSNKYGPFLREEISHFQWDNYFHTAIGSQDASADKPDPAPVVAALATLKLEASPDIWFVGDSIVDMECARRSGVTPVLYDPENLALELVETYHPTYVLRSFQELITIIRDLRDANAS